MHAQIRKVGIGLIIAFAAIFVQLNYVQIFAAEDIASNLANKRGLIRQYSIKRGSILTLDGVKIAESRPTKSQYKYRRYYPQGDLYAHTTGFYSLLYGSDRGIEASFHGELLGEAGVWSMQDIEDRFLGEGEEGDDIRTTIHSGLQQIAREALGTQKGAVVAMDPDSGEVRAMWSNPSYDPEPLAGRDFSKMSDYYKSLVKGGLQSPLINKVTARGYPPGSTFKVVTAAAALESGRYNPQSRFNDPERLELPLTDDTLTNFTKTACLNGTTIDLFTALRISCDTTFAMLGLRIPEEIFETAEALGFNHRLGFDVGTEVSEYPEIPDDREPERAKAAIGQQDVVATPLQMALVAATVANKGETPKPRLVREVIDASGSISQRFDYEPLDQAFSASTAEELTRMMVAVVESGTGTAAQIPGIGVAGKTGTAQTVPGAAPHAWFICFAPVADPELAVAVIVENGGSYGSEATGGEVAAPIARALLLADREIRGW